MDDWITLNEPNIYASSGYGSGQWPPGKTNPLLALNVIASQLAGHAKAAKALRKTDTAAAIGSQSARIGIANHYAVLEPSDPGDVRESINASTQDQIFNLMAIEAVKSGRITGSIPGHGGIDLAEPDLKGSVDYVGLNYYTRRLIKGTTLGTYVTPSAAPQSDLGFEIYPEGLFRALDRLRDPIIPTIITENGVADRADSKRSSFIVSHLMQVRRTLNAGINIQGYFYWSLMDNFEPIA